MIYLGIDPGVSGAIAALTRRGEPIDAIKLKETDHDVSEWLRAMLSGAGSGHAFAVLENVHAMPKQGVSSTFKFGRSFGFVAGLLVANQVPHELVTPQKWQGAMKCRSGGDKNVTKAAAQRLFPAIKIIHATADAYLLAEHARRVSATRGGET